MEHRQHFDVSEAGMKFGLYLVTRPTGLSTPIQESHKYATYGPILQASNMSVISSQKPTASPSLGNFKFLPLNVPVIH